MIEKLMALIGLLALIAFVVVIPIKVPHLDLILLVAGCVALASYDVWRHIATKRR